MDVSEPRAAAGFLHSDTTGDRNRRLENRGFIVRVRIRRRRSSSGCQRLWRPFQNHLQYGRHVEIRSGSVTGSRQRAHLPR